MSANGASHNETRLFQHVQPRIIDRFIIIWLDTYMKTPNEATSHLLTQLQLIKNDIKTFSDLNECTDFITDVEHKKVLLIISLSAGQSFLTFMEYIPQLYSIYIFQREHIHDDQWILGKNKLKGIFVDVDSICKALKRDLCHLMNESVPFSIVSTECRSNLNQLDQSFMYTTLLKEAILEIERDPNAPERFTRFCLNRIFDEPLKPEKIYEFQRCYDEHSPIWWYTKEKFVFSLLNQALRTQDTDFMIEMGFFLRDLHRDIERKYSETDKTTMKFVYRGQGLSNIHFNRIKEQNGCLLSFNNFLSTSSDRAVATMFAESNRDKTENVGVLFRIELDPKISSTPYAQIEDESFFAEEQEVLFSIQSIFRIGEIIEIQDRLWEVNLKFTSEDDPELAALTNYIRNEVKSASSWYSIATLMIKMGKYEKALEIYDTILQANVRDNDFDEQCSNLAVSTNIASAQYLLGKYSNALTQLQSLLEKFQDIFPPDHLIFCKLYNTVSQVYHVMGDYTTSLSYLEKALQILLRSSPTDYAYLSLVHSNIASTHFCSGEYMLALKSYEEALAIQEKSLPQYHPYFGTTYANIGFLYQSVGNNPAAITYLEKALEIFQRSVPPDHPDLAHTHRSLGAVQLSVGNYSMAQKHFEDALKILERSLPENHPNLGIIHNNIGVMYFVTRNYSDSLKFFKKAHKILEESVSEDHPWMAMNDSYIGTVYNMMGNYSKASVHLEKSLTNQQKAEQPNHQCLVVTYNGLGLVNQMMGNFLKSKSYYEKALEIFLKYLPPNHPLIANIYNNIGILSMSMGDNINGSSTMIKMIEIEQKSHATHQTHSSLAIDTDASNSLRQYENSCFEAASQARSTFEDLQSCFSLNHPEENPTEYVNRAIGAIKSASSLVPKFDSIFQDYREFLSSNPSRLFRTPINPSEQNLEVGHAMNLMKSVKNFFKNMENLCSANPQEMPSLFNSMGGIDGIKENLLDMFEELEKTIECEQKFLPPDNPFLATLYNSYGSQFCSMDIHSLALASYEKALERVLNRSPNNYQLLAKTHSNIATELDHLKRYAEAINSAEKAFQTAQSASEINNEEIECYRNQLQQLQRKT